MSNLKLTTGKILIIAIVAIVASSIIFFSTTRAGTTIGVTINSILSAGFPVDITTGLVGHWTFDGPDMTSNVADISGQGNNGSLSGQTATSTSKGVLGQALEFDGTDDYVDVGTGPSSVLTVSFWIKADDVTTRDIIDIDGTDLIEINGSSNVVATSFPAATVYVDGSSASATVSAGIWHFITVTDTTGVNASNMDIGREASDSTNEFDGVIDDVRLFNRALSVAEINRLYNIGATRINKTLVANENLNNGLVGHWTFDGPDMTSNVADISGQGNNGSLSGQTATSTSKGVLGQALKFDGTDDYVLVSDIDYTNQASGSLWVRFDEVASQQIFVAQGASTEIQLQMQGSLDSQEFRIRIDNAVGIEIADSITQAKANRWYHIAWVYDGTDVALYVDGINETTYGTNTGSGNINDFDSNYAIGARNDGMFLIDGSLDDVRIYNRALSVAEISRLYDLGTTTRINKTLTTNVALKNGLVGHWTFDGPDMTSNVADISGQGNNGFLSGQTSTTTAPGNTGQALEFDGTDDYVDIGAGPSTVNTVSFWIKADDVTDRKIIDIDGTDRIELNSSNSIVATDFPAATIYVNNSSASATVEGGWHHVVITDTTGVNASNMDIGRVSTEYFDGVLDDVRLYNRVLSTYEITRLYYLGNPRTAEAITAPTCSDLSGDANISGLWKVEETAVGAIRQDSSGSGNALVCSLLDDSDSIFKEGAHSADNTSATKNCVLLDASLSAGFPGTNGEVTTSASWGGWFRPQASDAGCALGGCSGGTTLNWRIAITAGPKWRCAMKNDSSTQFLADANGNLSYNTWYHVWCDWDGSTLVAYIDGVAQDDTEAVTSMLDDTSNFNTLAGAGNTFDGYWDESAVFNRSLSSDEIGCIYTDSVDADGLP